MDRFDYNTAIATSANEQMLLNLVRMRNGEVPVFLAVNSVLTQYVWTGEAGVAGATGDNLGFSTWTLGGTANARYIERPTVTYSPLSGQEFSTQLINPVRADVVFSLVSSGWPPDQLLVMTLQRINDVQNVSFADERGIARERSRHFPRVVELIVELARRDAIELVRVGQAGHEDMVLVFPETSSEETRGLVDEFKGLIALDPGHSRFRVTRKIVGRAPDEVTIRMHSLLELMGLLSSGVPFPGSDGEAGASASTGGDDSPSVFVVHRGTDRPSNAFVAVRYEGHWFYLRSDDERSKRAFGLLAYLFQMQASQNQGAGPLITVPIG